MKTIFNSTKSNKKNFEVISSEEMKQVQGGVRVIAIRDGEGNIRVVIIP